MPPGQIQPGQEEPLKKLARIVTSIMARPDSAPFLEPVDWRGLELWDYPTIVKKMMDLGTVKRKLERHQYEYASQVAADVRLIWKNCMLYNAERSDFWLLAKSLSKKFEDRYRRIKKEFYCGEEEPTGGTTTGGGDSNDEQESGDEDSDDDDEDDEEEEFDDDMDGDGASPGQMKSRSGGAQMMTLDAKARLASNLLILNGPELGRIITMIQMSSKPSQSAALETSKHVPHQMEIIIDNMEPSLFDKICKYAAEKASVRKRNAAVLKQNTVTTRTTSSGSGGAAAAVVTNNNGNNNNNNAVTTGNNNNNNSQQSSSAIDDANKRRRVN